jgi:hypothetical protein
MMRLAEDFVVNTANTRLRIATRIHFLLLRYLGEGVDVARMLKSDDEAREVLWVCEGSGQRELVTLAGQYRAAGGFHAPASRSSSPPSLTGSPTA